MPSIDHELIALLPNLRAYALHLTGNHADAEDLVQDTAVRLLGAANRFAPGTNFKAWAIKVLRNRFLNEFVAKLRAPALAGATSRDDPKARGDDGEA